MRRALLLLGLVLALGLLNWAVLGREQLIKDGEVIYLKLAPLDPRSLMQGDYMALRYAIARELERDRLDPVSGRIILRLDDQKIAHFERYDDSNQLNADERYLAYKNRRGAHFGLESFFFQEGRAENFGNADYAKIKIDSHGNAMLIDLVVTPNSDIDSDVPLQ